MSLFEQLPTLGVGASLSLAAQPDPVDLAVHPEGPDFIEYAGLVDIEHIHDDIEPVLSAGIPVLFHPSFINFCGSFENSTTWLDAADQHIRSVKSAWFAQDCAYCFWQDGYGYSSQFAWFLPPILNQASLDLAIKRIKEVQARISVPVAIEPPPFSYVVGNMPLMEFFARLSEACDCAILLDMGHLVSYEMASGCNIMDELEGFPFSRVIEVHIAGGKLQQASDGVVYVDAHEKDILPETWDMLNKMLPLLPNLKALCYECEGIDRDKVLDILRQLRQKTIDISSASVLVEKVESGGHEF